jgi:hypothetical protein
MLKRCGFSSGGLAAAVLFLVTAGARAQTYVTNFSTWAGGASILTNVTDAGQWMGQSGASATVSNQTYLYDGRPYTNFVVYQGEISNVFSRIVPDTSSNATAQLLMQIQWSDTMPDSTMCPDRQGGFCVSNGLVYAWSTNGWLRMTNLTAGGRQTVNSNEWIKVTFQASYRGETGGASVVFYRLLIDNTNFVPVDASQRYAHGSPFSNLTSGTYIKSSARFTAPGINGFYLSGSGNMNVPEAKPGDNSSPLSSGIDVGICQAQGGTNYIEFQTFNENGAGYFSIEVKDHLTGEIVWSGTQYAVGSSNNRYRIPVPGLVPGRSYDISITDEQQQTWNATAVGVSAFTAQLTRMSAVGLWIEFNSLPGRAYDIQWTPELGAPWQTRTNVTAAADRSSVFVFFPDPQARSGFFRIVLQ